MNTANSAHGWRDPGIALFVLLAWTLYWYADTLAAMVAIWARSDTYAHAFLVFPISLWLIWQKRHELSIQTPKPSWRLALLIGASATLWLVGELASANAPTQLALIATLVLTVVASTGQAISKKILFPLAFLFFSVPIGDFMLPQLMEWTASFTVFALRLSGIPVYREGLQFVIPSGNWSVVEACSGVRYIIASLTVGLLFAYLNFQSTKKRLVFTLFSLLVPVLANWLRAYMIVMLGHLSNNRLAAGVDHLIYGWLFFGLVITVMFWIGSRWSDPVIEAGCSGTQQPPQVGKNTPWPTWGLIALLTASGPLAYRVIDAQERNAAFFPGPLPAPTEWTATPLFTSWNPTFGNPSTEMHSAFARQGEVVGVYIAYYRNQDYDHKLITSTNTLVRSSDPIWSIIDQRSRLVELANSVTRVRSSTLLGKESPIPRRLTMWQWYWINGKITASEFEAKWLTALSRLQGHGDGSAAIVVYAPEEQAEQSLPVFTKGLATELDQLLNSRQASR
ncbi:MAG: exosortase A [Rhodocyclales bacterium GT-UBC]|nr:MAG: exosortase A [Rhodocyclales bacterium GT-UBC]